MFHFKHAKSEERTKLVSRSPTSYERECVCVCLWECVHCMILVRKQQIAVKQQTDKDIKSNLFPTFSAMLFTFHKTSKSESLLPHNSMYIYRVICDCWALNDVLQSTLIVLRIRELNVIIIWYSNCHIVDSNQHIHAHSLLYITRSSTSPHGPRVQMPWLSVSTFWRDFVGVTFTICCRLIYEICR